MSRKLNTGKEFETASESIVGSVASDAPYSIQSSSKGVYSKKMMIAGINYSKDEEKLFVYFEVDIQRLSSAERVVLECEWTDILQRLVDLGNVEVLKNIQYNLKMEHT